MRTITTSLAIAMLTLVACGSNEPAIATSAQEAKAGSNKSSKISTPILDVAAGATQTSIQIQVTGAATTGLPAGFSLQWMTADAYAANGNVWYSSDDAGLCKASFSGNANLSRYDLAVGEAVTVSLGEFLFDNGASTNCSAALRCGTEYVVRAFGHATSTYFRSDFTANLTASTLDCTETTGCTRTQGYWKNHGYDPAGNNENAWPVAALVLGTVEYSQEQLQAILDTPAKGNGLVALAHQLIAAKLNGANGADDAAVAEAIAAADALIGGLSVPPVGSGSLAPAATSDLTGQLAAYNEGATGPGHCE